MQAPARIDWTKALLGVWAILLIPWGPLAMTSGMAFDGGYTLAANVFVWSVLTYPVAVLIAAIFRRKVQWLVLLPCINIVAALLT